MATTIAPSHAGRLRSSRDVTDVLRRGRRGSGRLVVLHVRRRDDDEAARLAFVASRRVGSAVARNRAKRLLREAAAQLDWQDGVDVVLVARRACVESRTSDVRTELLRVAESLEVAHGR